MQVLASFSPDSATEFFEKIGNQKRDFPRAHLLKELQPWRTERRRKRSRGGESQRLDKGESFDRIILHQNPKLSTLDLIAYTSQIY